MGGRDGLESYLEASGETAEAFAARTGVDMALVARVLEGLAIDDVAAARVIAAETDGLLTLGDLLGADVHEFRGAHAPIDERRLAGLVTAAGYAQESEALRIAVAAAAAYSALSWISVAAPADRLAQALQPALAEMRKSTPDAVAAAALTLARSYFPD